MIRTHFSLFIAGTLLCGCQSVGGLFPNRFAASPEYSNEEMLAMNQPLSETTGLNPGTGMMPQGVNGQGTNNMQLASYNSANTPQQAGAESARGLVRAGQQAIENSGKDNPAGLQRARQLFEQALVKDATNTDAHHGIAIVADLQQDWKMAEQHYKQALVGSPSNPSLLNDLGYSYLLQNRYHESEEYLRQAMQISPQHEQAHLNLALLSLRRGDHTAARQTLASIYSQQKVQTNLARLEQDLQKLTSNGMAAGAANSRLANGGQINAMNPQGQMSSTAAYPEAQHQPANWPASQPGQNTNHQAQYASNGGTNAAYGGNSSNGLPNSSSANTVAIDPALRTPDSQKPISLYPPGMLEKIRAKSLAEANGAAQMHANAAGAMQGNQNQFPQVSASQYPSGQQSAGQYPSAQFSAAQFSAAQFPAAQFPVSQYPATQQNAAQFSGLPPGGSNQYLAQPNGMSQEPTPNLGLNIGPGMPFPVGGNSTSNMTGQANYGQPQVNQPPSNQQPGMYSPNAGQPSAAQNPAAQNPAAQFPAAQYPAAHYPGIQQPASQPQPGSFNASPVGFGQPSGAMMSGQANYNQMNAGQIPPTGNFPSPTLGMMNPGMGQAAYPVVPGQGGMGQPGMGQLGAQPHMGMPTPGAAANPMYQFEQQQSSRMNDQYQQALHQMNGQGFSGR